MIYLCKFKNSSAVVLPVLIINNRFNDRRQQTRSHNRHIFAYRIDYFDKLMLFAVFIKSVKVIIFFGYERISDYFVKSQTCHKIFNVIYRFLLVRFSAVSYRRIFELAKVYHPKSLPLSDFPIENNVLSVAVFGENENFFTLKGVIEQLLDNFAHEVKVNYIPCDYKYMHPTRSAFIKIGDETVGYFGQLNPILAEKLGSDKPILCGEIFYDVIKKYFVSKILFKNISKFPTVERDIAILVNEKITCKQIIDVIKESAGENLIEVSLFDIYQGDQVEKGKKSMAFNLVYNSTERTLNVEEIDASISNVLSELKDKIGAELR